MPATGQPDCSAPVTHRRNPSCLGMSHWQKQGGRGMMLTGRCSAQLPELRDARAQAAKSSLAGAAWLSLQAVLSSGSVRVELLTSRHTDAAHLIGGKSYAHGVEQSLHTAAGPCLLTQLASCLDPHPTRLCTAAAGQHPYPAAVPCPSAGCPSLIEHCHSTPRLCRTACQGASIVSRENAFAAF